MSNDMPKKKKKRNDPSTRERALLTRIYGDESNWIGVATQSAKIRRTETRRNKSARGSASASS